MRVREKRRQWATGRKSAFTSPPLSPHQMSWLLLNLNLESDTTARRRVTLLKEGWFCISFGAVEEMMRQQWLWSAIKLLLLDVTEVNPLCSAAAPRWMETGCSKTSKPTTQQLKVGVGSISSLAARYSEVSVDDNNKEVKFPCFWNLQRRLQFRLCCDVGQEPTKCCCENSQLSGTCMINVQESASFSVLSAFASALCAPVRKPVLIQPSWSGRSHGATKP